ILGLDARDLLEITLETGPDSYFIPAHIWTPWFSLFGSKSGFDTVEECFEDLTEHLFAMETGLSSDPPMNWRLSALDRYVLVSNSDAHSPRKLAREANLFDTDLSYPSLFDALHEGDPAECLGTLEFFPQEGKYHYDGHRKCDLRWDPQTTLAHDRICPACGKQVTVGVMHRVETLADRAPGAKSGSALPFRSLIPLPEILSEIHEVGANTKTVRKAYLELLASLGSELSILLDLPLEEIEQTSGSPLAEGIRRMRAGEVRVREGFDGEFGVISLFDQGELRRLTPQLSFLESNRTEPPARKQASPAPVVSEPERSADYATDADSGTAKPSSREQQTIRESLFASPG
ncbi:MAG TPA: endonuclease Q family protein, partial [Gammaproteobacteria bacterium]|nr:endonuclease Q family protein [Gammaproteobacteria bacterium]